MPLSTTDLSAVTTIIVHAKTPSEPCADGRASAYILRDALPRASIHEIAYNTDEHRTMEARPGMLFCDFTPPRERVEEFLRAGALVLDHHVKQKDLVEAFGARGIYADRPGDSGAVLAFKEVWLPLKLKEGEDYPPDRITTALGMGSISLLAGVRDTWQKESPLWREAESLSALLEFLPFEDLLGTKPTRLIGMGTSFGEIIVKRRREQVIAAAARAHRTSISGLRLAVTPEWHLVSDIAEELGSTADLVAAFSFDHSRAGEPSLVFHLRSRGENPLCDAGAIAKSAGGGGHAKAAGFTVKFWPNENPYAWIGGYLHAFMRGKNET